MRRHTCTCTCTCSQSVARRERVCAKCLMQHCQIMPQDIQYTCPKWTQAIHLHIYIYTQCIYMYMHAHCLCTCTCTCMHIACVHVHVHVHCTIKHEALFAPKVHFSAICKHVYIQQQNVCMCVFEEGSHNSCLSDASVKA